MSGKAQNSSSSFFFIANLLNFVLATAVFTIPFPMHEVGIILGTIILAVTCFLSVIACTFIIETLSMKNCLIKLESGVLDVAISQSDSESSSQATENIKNTKQISINNIRENKEIDANTEAFIPPETGVDLDEESIDDFYIFKRFEISKLSRLLKKPLYYYIVLTIICYWYVGVTSNAIIAGNNLKDIVGKTIGQELPWYSYHIIVSIFFWFTIIIALNNIKHWKKFSLFIMSMRFVVITLILGCCVYSIIKYKPAPFKEIPKFDVKNITVMIGNSLFVFMSHHSIPGMVENFSPQRNWIKLVCIGYFCSFWFIVLYGYVSWFAFSKWELTCDKTVFPNSIQSTFSSNFLSLPVIGYIINYYPVWNVITSGMQLITWRNNILEAIGGCSLEWMKKLNFSEKSGKKALLCNFLVNFCVCIPPVIIGLTLQNIQSWMKYFSSVLGFMLMLLVPVLLVFNYRKYFKKRKYIGGKLNKSFIQGNWGYVFIGFMSVVILGLIIYGFIANVKSKSCVNEDL